jgi:hypothetical protein
MSKIRLIMLTMLAVFAAGAIASASAAANGCEEVGGEKCLWSLNGGRLGVGEIRTLKRQWNSLQTLKGTVGAVSVTLSSKLVELKNAEIDGGIPGLNRGKIVFKNVEVVEPKGCAVNNGTVETEQLNSRLVELVKAGKPQLKDDILFESETGIFAILEFENKSKTETCGITAGTKANVEGNIQAEITAHGEEASHTLKAQGTEAWEYRPKGVATAKASQLKLAKKAATFEGTTNAVLTTGLNWGTD